MTELNDRAAEVAAMTEEELIAELPPLAVSITDQLNTLAVHAYTHGRSEERHGVDPGEKMPECLASHVGSLAAVLFGLAKPEEADSTIEGTIEVEMPEGMVERLQEMVTDALKANGEKS